jgi:hypothetical protein
LLYEYSEGDIIGVLLWLDVMIKFPEVLQFSGSFVKLRKATISFVMSVRPSIRMEQLGFH